jgi:2-methylcitrate dehydratase PrpD
MEPSTFGHAPPESGLPEVTLEIDGKTWELPVRPYKGSPQNPFTWEDISEKFTRYTAQVIAPARQQAIIAAVKDLEALADLAELAKLLSA